MNFTMNSYRSYARLALTLAALAALGTSCVIKPFSEGKNFRNVLQLPNSRLLATETDPSARQRLDQLLSHEQLILKKYRNFRDTTAHDNLLRFQEGCYLLRLENTEDTVRVLNRREKPSRNVVTITTSTASDTLLPPFCDKLSYLIFLDDHRVMYHSPYRKNYLKTGTFGKVNNRRNQADDTPNYARTTENFFKLGTRYEYNSCRRGYYKLAGNQLMVCLELNQVTKKCPYPSELLLLRFTTLPNPVSRKIETLVFNFAWYNGQPINISQTFQAFEPPLRHSSIPSRSVAPEDTSDVLEKYTLSKPEVAELARDVNQIRFSFLKTPFTLLLVDKAQGIHLVDSISTEAGGLRHYHCKLRHQRPGSPRPGTRLTEITAVPDSIFTY